MQREVYEYAVIRVVPRVDREEFINVGVIVFCKAQRFIGMRYELDTVRLQRLFPEVDAGQVEDNLRSFEKIAAGTGDGGPIALEDPASRFRWLTAVRSSVIQTSRPHPGLCSDPAGVLDKLFLDYVA